MLFRNSVGPNCAHLLDGWSAVCRIFPRLLLAFTLRFFTGLLLSASAVQRLCDLLAASMLPTSVLGWFGRAERFNPVLKRPDKPEVEGWLRALLLAVLDLTEDDGAPNAEVVLLAVVTA